MRAFQRLMLSVLLLSPILAVLPFGDKHIRYEIQLLPSYDYVVIGGGIAGLVVANRLSENNSTLHGAHCCSPYQCAPSHSHQDTDLFYRNLRADY
jgi:hypothetical protein